MTTVVLEAARTTLEGSQCRRRRRRRRRPGRVLPAPSRLGAVARNMAVEQVQHWDECDKPLSVAEPCIPVDERRTMLGRNAYLERSAGDHPVRLVCGKI